MKPSIPTKLAEPTMSESYIFKHEQPQCKDLIMIDYYQSPEQDLNTDIDTLK